MTYDPVLNILSLATSNRGGRFLPGQIIFPFELQQERKITSASQTVIQGDIPIIRVTNAPLVRAQQTDTNRSKGFIPHSEMKCSVRNYGLIL